MGKAKTKRGIKATRKTHHVYVVRCADDSLYTGYTVDLKKRLREHNGGGKTASAKRAGARYTRARRPVSLVYSESFPSRSQALQREYAIKKLRRVAKEALIQT